MSQTVTLDIDKAKVNIPLQMLLDQLAGNITAKATVTNVPKIGEPWPGQGGVYAGVMRGHGGKPDYHLILAVDHRGQFKDLEWGERGVKIAGADDEWDGQANTKAIFDAAGKFPAADAAAKVSIDGYNDFYLPSKRESALLYANLPERFEGCWHWTSTQVSAYNAAIQSFSNGDQLSYDKVDELRVRVVRRLTI